MSVSFGRITQNSLPSGSYEQFQLAYKSARAAVSEFMAAVGAQILRDGAYRSAPATCLGPIAALAQRVLTVAWQLELAVPGVIVAQT